MEDNRDSYRVVIGTNYISGDFVIRSEVELKRLIHALEKAAECLEDPGKRQIENIRHLFHHSAKGDLR